MEACADDLFELSEHLEKHPRAVIGHSLGGKVTLAFARRRLQEAHREADDGAHEALAQVWALDSDPGAQEPHHSHQVLQVLGALKNHPGPFASRQEAVRELCAEGLSSGLSNWLVTNLERSSRQEGATFSWRFELAKLEKLLEDYFRVDLWPFLEHLSTQSPSVRFELLVAENSDRWNGNMRQRAEALDGKGPLKLHLLPDAGHWVHVDNPAGLLDIMAGHLA